MSIGARVDYERHIRRGAVVDTIEEAFAFCLTGIEEETIAAPVISIEPVMFWNDNEDSDEATLRFEVSVSGSVARRAEGPENRSAPAPQ